MTDSITDNEALGESQLFYQSCGFLSGDGDFTLICDPGDFGFFETYSQHGGTSAFKVTKSDLAAQSNLFKDMFDVVKVEDEASVVLSGDFAGESISLLLSAMLEPKGRHLARRATWVYSCEALRLGVQWDTDKGRMGVFMAMLELLGRPSLEVHEEDVTEFLVEAAKRGESVIKIAVRALEQACQRFPDCVLEPFNLTRQHLMELGPDELALLLSNLFDVMAGGKIVFESV